MTEDNENYEIVEAEVVQLGTINASSPSDVIQRASAIARELAKIIKQSNLYTPIQGKNYVRVEGWNTLGAMMGIVPREREVTALDGGYEAYVELVRVSDGHVIGGASAICTREERNWSNRDEYAVRSMATTRATGKAFRLAFSWIMTLAGYEPTPAEEMPAQEKAEPPKKKKTKRETEKPTGPVGILLDLGVENTSHAAKIATLLKLTSTMTKKEIETKYSNYRSLRDKGLSPTDAVKELEK